ncbi:MAG TPA: response regulator [Myxococcaceae bacterium]|nr:response regulator [Myxococcaceae bacterium]
MDDDVTVAGMFQRYFNSAGYEVDIASAAPDAVRLAGQQLYSAALLDLRLRPSGGTADGLALLQRLRTSHPALVILVLTAFADARTTDEALLLGADRVLQKPQPLRDLAAILEKTLELRAAKASSAASVTAVGLH